MDFSFYFIEPRKEIIKMAKTKFTKVFKDIGKVVSKHSPEILTGIGIAGMITATVLAVKATPEAMELIDRAMDQKEDAGEEPTLTVVETVKTAWKPYVPAALIGATSAACLIGGQSVSIRRNAALATAYQLSTTALSEYKEKVVETIGEKKEHTIREKIAADKVEKNPVSKNEVFITGKGKTLFYEPVTSRYFEHDIDEVKNIVNEINEKMLCYDYISLNEFFDELGLSRCGIGNDIGWNIGRDKLIKIDYCAIRADDGRPCLSLDYFVGPRYNYADLK